MSATWTGREAPRPARLGPIEWGRIALRGAALIGLLVICFPLMLLLRLPESWIAGQSRPITPYITQFVCIAACRLLRLRLAVDGQPMRSPGAFVANHVSWLDIFVLNACKRIYFVAKAEVSGWPGIGWLARGTGTLFIRRDPKEAAAQKALFEQRLGFGHQLLFFPEGTSTDGARVLPFKTTLFAAFMEARHIEQLSVQPVTINYTAPPGRGALFYGWWGDMAMGQSLMQILAAPPGGRVRVTYHDPLTVGQMPSRKVLAKRAEEVVRGGLHASERAVPIERDFKP